MGRRGRRPRGSFRGGILDAATGGERGRIFERQGRGVWLSLLVVAVAYYLGARLGFVLRFPPATTSILWPPNAILTAALLLTAPRHFWRVLLAALPAHYVVQTQADFPLALILGFFVTNSLEAVLAAGLVHLWNDEPTRFDSLQRGLVFVGAAVLLAPTLSGIADAALVQVTRGEPFAVVYMRRLFSNVLSQLAIVPSAVLLIRHGRGWLARGTTGRRAEAIVMAAALVVGGLLVFRGYHDRSALLPGGSFTALPFLLPLLLVAAVRFGPAGASLSLLLTSILATGMAVAGATDPSPLAAEERVGALQVFLIVVGVPLFFLSAVGEERRQAAQVLRERLRFEELLSQISGAFVHLPSHEMPGAFATWLERLSAFYGLDRAVLWQFARERWTMVSVAWSSRLVADPPPPLPGAGDLPPRLVDRLLGHEPFAWTATEDPSPSAQAEKDLMDRLGVRSLLAIPLVAGGQFVGGLVLVSFRERREWTEATMKAAHLVADVFASALARRRAEDALRESEAMKSAVLASLTSHVAVLDRHGRIIAVNESWTRFARENGADEDAVGVGVSYLEACDEGAAVGPHDSPSTGAGIRDVLDGRRSIYTVEYTSPSPQGDLCFLMTVVPLNRPEGGGVVSHTDVTERRLAENEAQKSRDELAHYLRVSTVGELTTSIAHELNQPLAAILANAQAGRRLLANSTSAASLREVDEILADIAAEDRRAGEVIGGLRLLLRKGESVRARLDLNKLVNDVFKLVANDVMLRGVELRGQLAGEPLVALADRVQLQQALLNLLLNALEAMTDSPGDRTITVTTARRPAGLARVSVTDSGPGLSPQAGVDIFKPFFTTKPRGMGMGLSIARSIVESHGGTIAAERGEGTGATFAFTLPLVGPETSRDTPN